MAKDGRKADVSSLEKELRNLSLSLPSLRDQKIEV